MPLLWYTRYQCDMRLRAEFSWFEVTVSTVDRVIQASGINEDGVRFGRTLLRVQHGNWIHTGFDVVMLPNNRRGLLGVNFSSGRRIDGGLEVEREAMSKAPLTPGTAFVTGPGTLAQHGVTSVVHAVVNEKLGEAPRELPLRQSVVASLREVDRIKGRHIGMLILGSGTMPERISRSKSVPIMIEEIVGHLRRSSSRIEVITLLCNSPSEMVEIGGLLERLRRDWWGPRG